MARAAPIVALMALALACPHPTGKSQLRFYGERSRAIQAMRQVQLQFQQYAELSMPPATHCYEWKLDRTPRGFYIAARSKCPSLPSLYSDQTGIIRASSGPTPADGSSPEL
jgi:hypothetical protein